MAKGYFLSAHRSPANPEKRAAYLKLAKPAFEKAGGKSLASTNKITAKLTKVLIKYTSYRDTKLKIYFIIESCTEKTNIANKMKMMPLGLLFFMISNAT